MTGIVSSVTALPYGLRYLSKVLFETLKEKFPDEQEDNLLLNVGNLIYYRFINPAIIAPDGFDVIDLQPGEVLKTETRTALGRIARCLQSAAAGSPEESALPSYLKEFDQIQDDCKKYAKRLQTFFRAVINVPELDDKYDKNEYSEATEIQKPQVILNIKVGYNRLSFRLRKAHGPSTWKEYVFGWMSHPTYVISPSQQFH